MLIVSKFHDFYDVGMKMGVDKTVVYERKTIHISGSFMPVTSRDWNGWRPAVLAFCGTFYPFVYHTTDHKIDEIIWDVEEAIQNTPLSKGRSWDTDSIDTEIGLRKFFDKDYPELEELYHTHKTPIFGFTPVLGRHYSWMKPEKYKDLVISPNLKDIQFYKVIDPITAFQQIYMFISGVIGVPAKSTVEISDKVMAASKGHDGPYSFRKPPGKRGKNRWR